MNANVQVPPRVPHQQLMQPGQRRLLLRTASGESPQPLSRDGIGPGRGPGGRPAALPLTP